MNDKVIVTSMVNGIIGVVSFWQAVRIRIVQSVVNTTKVV